MRRLALPRRLVRPFRGLYYHLRYRVLEPAWLGAKDGWDGGGAPHYVEGMGGAFWAAYYWAQWLHFDVWWGVLDKWRFKKYGA